MRDIGKEMVTLGKRLGEKALKVPSLRVYDSITSQSKGLLGLDYLFKKVP